MVVSGSPVLYFETAGSGHRAHYVAVLAKYLTAWNKADQVIFAGPAQLRERAFAQLGEELAETSPRFQFVELPEKDIRDAMNAPTLFQRHRRCWQLGLRAAQRCNARQVFFAALDHILLAAATSSLPPFRVSGLLFRGSSHWRERRAGWLGLVREGIKEHALRVVLAKPWFENLFTLDPYFKEYMDLHSSQGKKVILLPEPFDAPCDAAQAWGARMSGRVRFLFFGSMQERKGIRPLLDALLLLPRDVAAASEFRFCGEGEMLSFIEERLPILRSAGLDVSLERGFLPRRQLEAEISACDVVLAPYLGHVGSSGVLLLAAAFRKPILTQQEMLLGAEVRRYQLGEPVDTRDPIAIAEGICRLNRECLKGFEGTRQFDAFISRHGKEKFAECLGAHLFTHVAE
ncbi:MAG: hypothetical protein KatS3mg119_1953 [Rhodothalassiaceae bacterium]|nr:MAG: hypothetical protein KatS3mg119_1953 [Rhodothalassiaceae bacterium]